MGETMLKIKKIDFWSNVITYIFMVIISLGIPLILVATGIIRDDNTQLTELFRIFVGICGSGLIFFGSLMIWTGLDEEKCYYCQKKIINVQKRIVVEWTEMTKYSGKEMKVNETMHVKCHEEAEKKFQIPDPRFSQIPI